jgi:hypothetical protein
LIKVWFVFLALLDGAVLLGQVVEGGEALHALYG